MITTSYVGVKKNTHYQYINRQPNLEAERPHLLQENDADYTNSSVCYNSPANRYGSHIANMIVSTHYIRNDPFSLSIPQVSSKKQEFDVLACDEALQNVEFDPDYLSICGVLPEDVMRCQKLTCSNADSSRLISTLSTSSVMCGGSDGRTPGVLVTITDFSGQILLRKTFYGTQNVTIGPNSMLLTMMVTHKSFGISFEVSC